MKINVLNAGSALKNARMMQLIMNDKNNDYEPAMKGSDTKWQSQ